MRESVISGEENQVVEFVFVLFVGAALSVPSSKEEVYQLVVVYCSSFTTARMLILF